MSNTFFGSFFGFLFGIALFYLTEKIKSWNYFKNLKKYLKRELKYNIGLLEEWEKDIDSLLRKITAGDSNVYIYLRYTDYQKYFTHSCFNTGILYDHLSDEEIANFNTILLNFDFGREDYLNRYISEWKNKTIDNKTMLDVFEFQKKNVAKYIKDIKSIITKIK